MDVEGGSTAAVFGLGAVGLSVIQGPTAHLWAAKWRARLSDARLLPHFRH